VHVPQRGRGLREGQVMKARRRHLLWLLPAVVAFLILVVAPALAPFLWMTEARGFRCSSCGAYKSTSTRTVLGIELEPEASQTDSALTNLRTRLGLPCDHNWVADWTERITPSTTETGDCFPFFDYPPCQKTDKLAEAVGRLKNDESKKRALAAIADQNNFLRWLAHDALIDLAHLSEEEHAQLDKNAWWTMHGVFFEVVKDRDQAKVIALKHVSEWSAYGAGKTILLLELDKEDIVAKPAA